MNSISIWMQLAGFLLTAVITIIGTTWKVSRALSRQENTFIGIMSAHQLSDNVEFNRIRAEIDQSGDMIRRENEEVGTALREKLHDIELSMLADRNTNLNTFARRESFYEVTKEMSVDIKTLIGKVHELDSKMFIRNNKLHSS